MGLTLRTPASLRFQAQPGSYLYDCHGGRFVEAEHDASATSGFVPLYLSQLFGVPIAEWNQLTQTTSEELESTDPERRKRWLDQHAPKGTPRFAAETALLVYPTLERFVERCEGAHAPFRLSERWLMQPNVPLSTLTCRPEGGGSIQVLAGLDSPTQRALARELLLALGSAKLEAASPQAAAMASSLQELSPPQTVAEPGVYLCGHSSVLIRGRRAGLLLDPIGLAPCGIASRGLPQPALEVATTAVALTHLHFDHYDLATLLSLSDRPIIVPHVPQASIVAEDASARLREFGASDVRTPLWGQQFTLEDLTVHVLPFRGEQMLTSEEHPQARNWGNCYAVDVEGLRILVIADAGFEKGRSMLEEIGDFRAEHGPVDVIITQAGGMRMQFGGGDADFQIAGLTCAHRAPEALALLAPEHRMTMAPGDVPTLCEASGARTVILNGQFSSERDSPSVPSSTFSQVQQALQLHPAATLRQVSVGHGLRLPDLRDIQLPL